MMKISIVIIGDEILLGRVTDTNSGCISRAMDTIGGKTIEVRTVGDDRTAIRSAVENALNGADIVFTTGGLGPTKDDITKRVLTEIFGGETIRDAEVTENIRRIFDKKGLRLNSLTLDQALVPSSAIIIQNQLGTAPIMVFEKDGKTVISMPGVPAETEGMLPRVVEYLVSNQRDISPLRHVTRLVTGMSESALSIHLEAFESSLPRGFKLAYLPDSPVIKLRLDGPADSAEYDATEQRLDGELDRADELTVLAREEMTLGEAVIRALGQKGYTMSTAESCTGGNIARTITAVPGASAVFNGGAVTYANSAKINVLGVDPVLIDKLGAVSEPVVRGMIDGACRVFGTDCAVATSGIAGPGGGTPGKPVGTVWISVHKPGMTISKLHHFPGNRDRVITRATAVALIELLKIL